MAEAVSFEEIVRQQAAALTAALAAEAANAGVELTSRMTERLGRAVVAGGDPEAAQEARAVRELFRGTPPLALIAFDTPGVHDYVFRVRRPVDLAGGSRFVAAFTDPERAAKASICPVQEVLRREGHHEGALVFAGGGRGLAVVAAHRAEGLRAGIEAILDDATKGDLRTVTAALPVWPDDLGPEPAHVAGGASDPGAASISGYSAAVSVLMGRLARERSRSERFGDVIDSKAPRCSACRRRVGTLPRQKTAEWICAACSARRDLGGTLKRDADEAKTFQDLVDESDRRLALLYADGANVGAAFQEVDSMARHRALSKAVEGAFDDAVGQVVKREELKVADERQLYQMPIRGGDDAILILPARFAFEAAVQIVRSVEAGFSLKGNPLLRDALAGASPVLRDRVEQFGVGVGLVFADCHFPVGFLVRYAEELLKSAKRLIHRSRARAREGRPPVRSAVDYLLLASGNPLSESIDGLRLAHFRHEPRASEPGLLFTERPFSIERLEEILRDARALREVPPTQRFAIRQEVFRGEALSRSLWRYQHSRAKEGQGWAAYRKALRVDLDRIDELLWRRAEPPPDSFGGDWRSTSYLDALEVLDLLPDEHRGGSRETRR